MLNNNESNKGELDFSMTVTTSRKIEIYWQNLATQFKLNHQHKQVVFIDPIVLGSFPDLVELELTLPDFVVVPTNIGEKEKEVDTLLSILSLFEQEGIGRRNEKIYSVGGGVLIDVVSLACSIFRRGIYLTKVPTTLLGFIDASIGLKSGVNFLGQRNRLGSYNAKFEVILDSRLLATLDKALIQEGLGEIFKIAIIKSEKLFNYIEKSKERLLQSEFYTSVEGRLILSNSLRLMLEEIHENPEEDILRRCVDFGHTFSPLVEMESVNNFSYKKIPHGYAVAYDCLLSSIISNTRGILTDRALSRICDLYFTFDFDLSNPIYMDHDIMWASVMELTKHRGGNQHIPIPTAVGIFTFIEDLTYNEMIAAKNRLSKIIST